MEQWIDCQDMRSHRSHPEPLPFDLFAIHYHSQLAWGFFLNAIADGFPHADNACFSLGILGPLLGANPDLAFPQQSESSNLNWLKHIPCQPIACHGARCFLQVAILAIAWKPPFTATRVGEAKNPGPNSTSINCAISNPTAIYSKASVYRDIATKHDVHLFVAAETSATTSAQRSFNRQIRKLYSKQLWSQPVPDHREKTDGTPSLRGKASGVALLTSRQARHAQSTIPPVWQATSRILHAIITIGTLHLQMVVIYALPSSHQGSNQFNNDLLTQAIQIVDAMPLPAILLGDFNGDPSNWDQGLLLQTRGFTDLKYHYTRLNGCPMPPTCRDVTHPDNALFCPRAASWLTHIQVLDDQCFDTHKVVLFPLGIPSMDLHNLSFNMPQTFTDLPLDPNLFCQVYEQRRRSSPLPDLETWGQQLERVIDETYRLTQCKLQGCHFDQTHGLPKKYRGRCQPKKLTKKPVQTLTRIGRPGDYNPELEVHTYSTRAKVRQVRRPKSLKHALSKPTWTLAQHAQACREWFKILHSTAFQGNFVKWAQQHPEIPWLPLDLPTYDVVNLLYQLAKYETDQALWFDRKVWLEKVKYRQQLDRTLGGHTIAFAELQKTTSGTALELHQTVQQDAILAEQEPGVWQAYLEDPSAFNLTEPIYIGDDKCTCQGIEAFHLTLRPEGDIAINDEAVTIRQNQVVQHPRAIADTLQQFWNKYWLLGEDRLSPSNNPNLQPLLDQLPPLVDLNNPDFVNPALWHSAVQRLKNKSARGIDGISAAELKALPQAAITDLATVLLAYTSGFPAWLMVARTTPVPKKPGSNGHCDFRPITTLAQTYRLWSHVISRVVWQSFAKVMPEAITGFLPGRSPLDAAYSQQFDIEHAHHQHTQLTGVCLDLEKCFNTINRQAAAATLVHIGIPALVVRQWEDSLQSLSRTWCIQQCYSDLTPTDNGCPEGDPFSVVAMLGVGYTWQNAVKLAAPQAGCSAYADNWSWTTKNANAHPDVLQATNAITTAFGMKVDWNKTWAWGTSANSLPHLKQAFQNYLTPVQIKELTTSMDLGCHMQYRGPPRLGGLNNRIDEALRRLAKIQHLQLPIDVKQTLVSNGVYPVAMYGFELIPMGTQKCQTLRTNTANAILGESA